MKFGNLLWIGKRRKRYKVNNNDIKKRPDRTTPYCHYPRLVQQTHPKMRTQNLRPGKRRRRPDRKTRQTIRLLLRFTYRPRYGQRRRHQRIRNHTHRRTPILNFNELCVFKKISKNSGEGTRYICAHRRGFDPLFY
jgi:hypothetical protein